MHIRYDTDILIRGNKTPRNKILQMLHNNGAYSKFTKLSSGCNNSQSRESMSSFKM